MNPQNASEFCSDANLSSAAPEIPRRFDSSDNRTAITYNDDTANDFVIARMLQEAEDEEFRQRNRGPELYALGTFKHAASIGSAGSVTLVNSAVDSQPFYQPQTYTVDLDAATCRAAVSASGLPSYSTKRPMKPPPLQNQRSCFCNPCFLWTLIFLIIAAVAVPLTLLAVGVIKTSPEPVQPDPVWIDWYNDTTPATIPNCSILQQPSLSQPSYANFPIYRPNQPDPNSQQEINLNTQYGFSEASSDNFRALQKALDDCQRVDPKRGCKLTMRKGIYRFAMERPLWFYR